MIDRTDGAAPAMTFILGNSIATRRAIAMARRFASTDLPVLLLGPTGSGKELFARQIHRWSGRAGPWVDVNAGALPRDMVESLLFGHRRGAFTGAFSSSEGLLVAARNGTCFLDELPSLPVEGQAKLLRALESGEVRPLGETANRPIGCRFIAAAQPDLGERMAQGAFRHDLYQRLAGVVIQLPALHERPDDILPLARAFAEEFGCMLDEGTADLLLGHHWPGNIRELRTVIRRAACLDEGPVVSRTLVEEALTLSAPLHKAVSSAPASSLAAALIHHCRAHDWDVSRAAAALGVGRSTLYRRLRAAGVDPTSWRLELGLSAMATP